MAEDTKLAPSTVIVPLTVASLGLTCDPLAERTLGDYAESRW
jgi:hypothetical protein